MSNVVSSLIFAHRNVGKTQNGEIGRAPVAAAQAINVINEVSKYNKTVAQGTDAAVSIFTNLAKTNKAADYAVKGVNWATKHVNPMIAASGVIKVAMAEDKLSAGIKETAALGTMFAGEKLANMALKALAQCKNPKIAKLFNTNTKVGAIVHGLLFVAASIASYSVGEKLGDNAAKEIKTELNYGRKDKINQMA